MTEALPNENKQVAETQAANAEAFFEELQKEAHEANDCVKKFREKLVNHHGQGPGKSFLKAPLRVYEAAVPTIDLEVLKKTFAIDIETCKSILERVEVGRDMVVANYPKFMAQQQEALREFIKQQQKIIYGLPKLDFNLDDIKRTDRCDEPCTDKKIRSNDKEYRVWILRAFENSKHARLDDE